VPTENTQGFWRKIWKEAEPIIAHAVIILILEGSLLLIGLGTLALEHLFPKQEAYFSALEKVDIWMSLALLCMFGLYTIVRVSVRLFGGVRDEVRMRSLDGKGDDHNDGVAP
jgi:hypothetical protein